LGRDNVLRTWDPATGRQTRGASLDPITSWTPFALSRDGKVFAAADYDRGALVLYDRDTGKPLRKIPTPNREIDRPILSPEGKWVAGTGRGAKAVRVWETATGKLAFETPAQPGGWWADFPACAFSPDGRYFVSSDDQVLRFWEVDGWKPAGELA